MDAFFNSLGRYITQLINELGQIAHLGVGLVLAQG